MVKTVIIGCGSITLWRHAPECAQSKNIDLVGFYDRHEDRCKEFAEKYNAKAYKSYEEVLADENVDAVIICTANKYHCSMAVEAFKSGKHVLCEKPVAVNKKEAKKMIAAAKKYDKKFMVAHSQRFDAVNQKLKQITETENIGRIISFRTVFGHRGPETWSATKGNSTWFMNKKEAGLGALGDIGIHKADLIHWIINDNIKYVTATVKTLDKKLSDGSLIAMEDNAFCILESEKGICGTMEASWTRYGKEENLTELYCENATVRADSTANPQITVSFNDGSVKEYKAESLNSMMAESFADCIINGKEPELSGEEALKALNIVLGCIESSEKGKKIKL